MVDYLPKPQEMKNEEILRKAKERMRAHSFSRHTERAYGHWVRCFLEYRTDRRARELSGQLLAAYLEQLTSDRQISGATHRQARNALNFLFREVLQLPVPDVRKIAGVHAKGSPPIFSKAEIALILRALRSRERLIVSLMYGCGLKVAECLNLRVKDLQLERSCLDLPERTTCLPRHLAGPLQRQVDRVRIQHIENLSDSDFWGASLPDGIEQREPGAARDLRWQFLFPAQSPSWERSSGLLKQFHLHASCVQKRVKKAIRKCGIEQGASCQTFRHTFAVHLLEAGYDVRTVQALMGHRSIRSTMVYTRKIKERKPVVRSPLDELLLPEAGNASRFSAGERPKPGGNILPVK